MQSFPFRVIKSVGLFFLVYFSAQFLGLHKAQAVALALIPLILGAFGIMTSAAYAIAALIFILAAFSSLLRPHYANALDFVSAFVTQNMGALGTPADNDDARAGPPEQ